ncbi:N-formylglutamate amidohydrolase [Pseudochryseolinea flava]|uniref:N-formylglutamate amidohydrolase n=1 Tax=Pseudochryseolinea flava TaxID=2059302 RepID=A0A364Y3U7_9BACT|nr:N-formylglutamate amidohydrolase [Pseudochryseolinea flava]RAW00689.1 N-formylglutamate amidohydrolase [Pseudochryseolinea flava]
MKLAPIITCEHAGNTVPERYAKLFHGVESVLESHRGWDPGAEGVAHQLALQLKAPLHTCRTTRLLIEPNRSLGNHDLFSEFSADLSNAEKDHLVQNIYVAYRHAVVANILDIGAPVVHLSIHTFTPMWNGETRDVDIGLLFDPERKLESDCCARMSAMLKKNLAGYKIKMNEPYRGIDDGFTTFLRTHFRDQEYAGIEIEINQKFVDTPALQKITAELSRSIAATC